eukprot:s4378_g2.t1
MHEDLYLEILETDLCSTRMKKRIDKLAAVDFSTSKQNDSFHGMTVACPYCMSLREWGPELWKRFCKVLQPPPPVPMGHPAGPPPVVPMPPPRQVFLQPLLPFSPGNLSNAFMIVAPAALKLALPVPPSHGAHATGKGSLGSSAPLAAAAAAAQALRPRPGCRRLASASQGVAVEWQTLRSRIVETPTGKEPNLDFSRARPGAGRNLLRPLKPGDQVRYFGSSRQTPRVTFYRDSAALCPRCQAVWLLLEAKRIDYIVVKENLPSYGERSEAFLRKVPRGALPAIEIDGRWATDSLDAMFLLERTFPNPERPMIPGFSRLRGRAIELLELQRAVHSAWCNYLFRAEMSFVNEPAVDFAAALGQERDTDTPWFLPYEHPTIVDIQYVCTLERIVASAFFYKAMDVRADFPGIDRWLRAFEDPSERRELPWYRATRGDYYSLCMALEPAFGEPQPSPMNNSSRTDWRKLLPENYRLPFALRRDVEMTAAEAALVLRRPFVEAAWKLVQNHDEARYCCRAVGGEAGSFAARAPTRSRLADPKAAIVEGLLEPLDALLCSVAQMLFDEAPVEDLQSQMQKRVQVYGIPEKLRPRLASCLAYLRDRIGVPRDLPLPAAKMLNLELIIEQAQEAIANLVNSVKSVVPEEVKEEKSFLAKGQTCKRECQKEMKRHLGNTCEHLEFRVQEAKKVNHAHLIESTENVLKICKQSQKHHDEHCKEDGHSTVPALMCRKIPEPRVAVGIVTSYDSAKGFGFLKVDGIQGDVFFARSELPPELREEDKKEKVIHKVIEFELQKKSDGKLRARKLLFLHRNLEGVGQRTRGRVAKYHQDKGYGFLECEYGDNVFFLRSSLPKDLNEAGFEELSQLEISFQIYFKEQGKPRAQNLEIVGRERREERPQLQGGEVLIGEIVTFEPGKGFGFVRSESCDEDVYFVRPELPAELAAAERKEEVVGERVEFEHCSTRPPRSCFLFQHILLGCPDLLCG